jgi:hypothetical protein
MNAGGFSGQTKDLLHCTAAGNRKGRKGSFET